MITESQIRSAIRKVSAKERARIDLRDRGARGAGRLLFRVRATGENSIAAEFYAIYFRNGRRAFAKIGNYDHEGRGGGLPLADARKKFQAEFAPAIVAGAEPASLGARRQAQSKPGTVTELFTAYVESLRIAGRRSAGKVERILLRGKSYDAASAIGADRPANEIEPGDISAFLAMIYSRGAPVMAVEARCYLHAAFAYGLKAEHDYRRQTAAGVSWRLKSNPVAAVPADTKASKPGQRFLSPTELRTFWHWLCAYETKSRLAPGMRLLLATGQRIEEITGVSVTSYDKAAGMLYWEKTKNGRPHSIPLPRQAVTILDGLTPNEHGLYFAHRRHPERPSPGEGFGDIVERFLEAHPEIPRFVPRDARRTWKTCAGMAGLSKEERDALQNHIRSDVASRHYDRYDRLREKRAAMVRWEAWLDLVLDGEIVDLDQRGVVVAIREGKGAA